LLTPSVTGFGAHLFLKPVSVEFDEKCGWDVASFHPTVVIAAAPLNVVHVVPRGNYSSRLGDSMFIETLLFDALVFMRVPAIPVKSCTYFWIQNVQEFV